MFHCRVIIGGKMSISMYLLKKKFNCITLKIILNIKMKLTINFWLKPRIFSMNENIRRRFLVSWYHKYGTRKLLTVAWSLVFPHNYFSLSSNSIFLLVIFWILFGRLRNYENLNTWRISKKNIIMFSESPNILCRYIHIRIMNKTMSLCYSM